jgi:hypothetical protein
MPRTETSNARHQEALVLRNQGLSYGQIAVALGYGPYPSAARYAVLSAMRENNSLSSTGDRSFGVEVEFYNITRGEAEFALQQVNIPVVIAGRRDAVANEWKITTDGSVTSTNTGCGTGLELVSPILSGKNGYKTLKKAINALKNAGARVNVTCGIHTHLGMQNESNKMIAEFATIYFGVQLQLEWLVSKSRRGGRNSYTRPMSSGWLRDVQQQLSSEADGGSNSRTGWNFSRYSHFNITALDKHGTVELRMMNGSVNSKKVMAWVELNQALANLARTNMETNATFSDVEGLRNMTIEQVLDLAVQHGLSVATRNFLFNRAQANMRAVGYNFASVAA